MVQTITRRYFHRPQNFARLGAMRNSVTSIDREGPYDIKISGNANRRPLMPGRLSISTALLSMMFLFIV